MQLLELQRAFMKAARREALAFPIDEIFVGGEALDARARLEVYAGAFFARQLGALREFYPATSALLGEGFLPLARRYLLGQSGAGAALESMTHGFPSFLGGGLQDTVHPQPRLVLEVAQLELARNRALLAPDEERAVRPAEMSLLTAAQKLCLSAGVAVVQASQRAQQLFDGALQPEECTKHLLLWRPGFRVKWRPVAEDEARALGRVGQGGSLGAVCEEFLVHPDPGQRVYEVLSRWVSERVLSRCVVASEGSEA